MTDTGSDGPVLGIPGIDNAVEIGRTASQTTYRVRDIATGGTFVIKLLNADRERTGLSERFEREQSAIAALGHPNIVRVLGHGWTVTGVPFIVTGDAVAETIVDQLRGPTPMTGPDILGLAVRLAGAVESAHRAGVLHGDLRSADMRISADGEPLLDAFGVAALVGPNHRDVTDPADLAHVAPELLEGEPISIAGDVYSLASSLFALFAGVPAYVGPDDHSVLPVIRRIASDPVPDLSTKNVPVPVIDAISKGMAKDPAERHRTAQAFGRALQEAQGALGFPETDMAILDAPEPPSAGAQWAATPAPETVSDVAPETPSPGTVSDEARETVSDAALVTAAPDTSPPTADDSQPPFSVDEPDSARPANRTPLVLAAIAAVVVIATGAFFALRAGDDSTEEASTTTTTATSTTTTTTLAVTSTTTASTTPPVASDSTESVTNDGGQLAMSVPTSWADRDITPTVEGFPSLWASTNLPEFAGNTFVQPGIAFEAFPSSTIDPSDLSAVLDQMLLTDRNGSSLGMLCTRGARSEVTPGGGGLSAGQLERLSDCGDGGDVIIMAATNAEHTFTALVEVHLGAPPDDSGVETVTTSFSVVQFP